MTDKSHDTHTELLLSEMVSAAHAEVVSAELVQNENLFKEIIEGAFDFERPHCWRLWWYIDKTSEYTPSLLEPYLSRSEGGGGGGKEEEGRFKINIFSRTAPSFGSDTNV